VAARGGLEKKKGSRLEIKNHWYPLFTNLVRELTEKIRKVGGGRIYNRRTGVEKKGGGLSA